MSLVRRELVSVVHKPIQKNVIKGGAATGFFERRVHKTENSDNELSTTGIG